jgi:nicotinamide-nucleotide amidase
MVIELINTGSELMLGRVLNTHQQWFCRKLADLGYVVSRQVAIADTAGDIQQAVRESLARADLIITTGGLGPTCDDLTRDLIAEMLGTPLCEDPAVLAHIKRFFDVRNRSMPDRTRVQALVPQGALVLPNPHGTAPGLAMKIKPNPFRAEDKSTWLLMLPGPPRELRPMFADSVVPLLRRELPLDVAFISATLRITGLGESLVEERIKEPLADLVASGLDLGYCARPGQVDVRMAAWGAEAEIQVRAAQKIVRERLQEHIFGSEDEELSSVVIDLLRERQQTLILAESCTGGYIANQLTNVPGASAVFLAGLVTYSNEAKQKLLGVPGATIEQHGAVSEAVARLMAEGAKSRLNADYALSVTGIAGPGGGTAAKPVGTVFIALAGPFETIVQNYFNPFDRLTFKDVTAQQALNMLRRKIHQGI